uniref:non-specific serine/threonine protein kinase n=1 Tax=Nelumbo nucifera TaxID=4432 RepID=A0A822Y2W0_NELNU|nr:TPA_asm: hypothetical protein HUJ06_025431 [Nelumbo nucifera]
MSLLLCIHIILLSFLSINVRQSTFSATARATTTTTTGPGESQRDRTALLAFKARVTHDPFDVMSSWNSSLHYCEWQGVTCSTRQYPRRVRLLDLRSQGLVGSLPPDIGNLSFLSEIRLQGNRLHGEIPQEIGNFFRLNILDLSNNSLQGEIPSNLSRCSSLIYLALDNNNLTGNIPTQVGFLSLLENLRLHHNNLRGEIPSSVGNISFLETLSLSKNSLQGSIPESLSRLTRLRFLALGANELTGIVPPSLYNLSSISTFSLVANHLQGNLPMDIGFTLPDLQVLNIGGNQFTGTVPVSLSNLSKLEFLDIKQNNFTGKVSLNFGRLSGLSWLALSENQLGSGHANDLSFVTTLVNCTSLKVLSLDGNNFGGVLPTSISNLSTQLVTLTLGYNQMSGRIPTGIGNLVNLNVLGIEFNQLTGSIPNSIGKLQMLQKLSLSGNHLSGQIPSSLGNLTLLNILALGFNNLNCSIPPSMGNCQSLIYLDLSYNNLTGTVPKQVIGLSSLSICLNLAQNQLLGPLPLEVGNLKSLGILDLSENKLSGEIPITIGECLSLEYVYLEGNVFQGPIPSSLGSLRGIQELDLSRNNFTGKIPAFVEKLSSLVRLNLSFNDLEGEIPIKGIFLNGSAFSVIGNNKLCGGIPELHLQACHFQESKSPGISLASKLIIATSISVVLLCSVLLSILVHYWTKKPKETLSSTSFIKDGHAKVSYEELLRATGGFSSANLIGVGSFGSVYKGTLGEEETVVAVKVLNLQQRGALKSFIAECESLRNIRHRNLIKIITSCSSIDFEGNDFKALENWLHPEVDDAHDQLRILNLPKRLSIAIDVASALDYLHNHCQVPVIHCDLKPTNVLLDDNFTAHVGDFGLSRFLSENTGNFSMNQTGSIGIRGSIGYAAPEYGLVAEVSTHGDIYSYGILLLELFIGKRPTDEMFLESSNLHHIAKMSLPNRVMEVVDPMLLQMGEDEGEGIEAASSNSYSLRMRNRVQDCLVSVLRVGVSCSMESPKERMDMRDVVKELHLIRDIYLGFRTHGQKCSTS